MTKIWICIILGLFGLLIMGFSVFKLALDQINRI